MLILINGRPSREILEGGLVSDLMESFPVNILERIEVIKGPGSVLYGSNAFSAVVNLIVRKSRQQRRSSLSGAAGRAGAFATSALATVKCGDLNVVGTVQFHTRPDWVTPYRYPPSLGDPFANNAMPVSSATIRDRAPSAYRGGRLQGLQLHLVLHAVGVGKLRSRGSRCRPVAARVCGRRLHRKGGRNWDMSVNATYTRNTFDATGSAKIERASRELVLEWTNFVSPTPRDRADVRRVVQPHSRTRDLSRRHSQYHDLGGQPAGSGGVRAAGPSAGGYLEGDRRLPGEQDRRARPGRGAQGGRDLESRPTLSIKALYGQAFRAPSINETRLDHPGLAGNPDLVPEKVGTFDLGLTYHDDRVQAGVNYFRSRLTNGINVDTSEARWKYHEPGRSDLPRASSSKESSTSRRSFFLLGSVLYQTNRGRRRQQECDADPQRRRQGRHQLRSGQGPDGERLRQLRRGVDGYAATLNPGPDAHHLVNVHLRFDVSDYWRTQVRGRLRAVHQRRQRDQPAGVDARLGRQYRRHHSGQPRPNHLLRRGAGLERTPGAEVNRGRFAGGIDLTAFCDCVSSAGPEVHRCRGCRAARRVAALIRKMCRSRP